MKMLMKQQIEAMSKESDEDWSKLDKFSRNKSNNMNITMIIIMTMIISTNFFFIFFKIFKIKKRTEF